MPKAETIVIAGSLAQKPRQGGHAWVFLQYLLGLRRLGWEVLFIDALEPAMCVDDQGRACDLDHSINLAYLRRVMTGFDLGESFALIYNGGERVVGLSRSQVLERVKRAACLINVMGFLNDAEILAAAPRRVFLDIDPGFGQMWQALGLARMFRGHEDYVTIGQNIGQPGCLIPTCGIEWITTAPPVVLDYWPQQPPAGGGCMTSVMSWRGAYGPLEYQGKAFGLRVHEFRKFIELPRLTGRAFQLALDIHPSEVNDLARLAENRWMLVNPRQVAGEPSAYQSYIQHSKAEFMVAKNMYVQSNSGWFSDRSVCYLASGRPVLAQETGLRNLYSTDEGLLAFATLEEAAAGVEALSRDYERHARAARAIAESHFDSDKVLRRLLGKLGLI
ncbi:MAG TPA: glycosyltransferase [Blastocatellia bacterium]|nr:glycosyltransferase [Blastocatellia bacterium]